MEGCMEFYGSANIEIHYMIIGSSEEKPGIGVISLFFSIGPRDLYPARFHTVTHSPSIFNTIECHCRSQRNCHNKSDQRGDQTHSDQSHHLAEIKRLPTRPPCSPYNASDLPKHNSLMDHIYKTSHCSHQHRLPDL